MSYPFHYEVIVMNPLEDTPTYSRECGMGFCETYTEAMNYIENYYDDELIAVKHLELLEENDLIIMPKQYIWEYVNDNFTHPLNPSCDANGKFISK